MFVSHGQSAYIWYNFNNEAMKQPETGTKISELRNQKGITQKELSESCNIDIRTIQRIESGEVLPRMSTLRLIANALSCDISIFYGEKQDEAGHASRNVLLTLFFVGILYFISVVIISPVIHLNSFFLSIYPFNAFVYIITGVLFYYGFYTIGKHQKNRMIQISSIGYMVCIPLLLLTALTLGDAGTAKHIRLLIILLLAANNILFGTGLLKVNNQWMNLYRVTGILHIIIVPFIVIPISIISIIGWWLIFLSILLQLCIVYCEFKSSPAQQIAAEIV